MLPLTHSASPAIIPRSRRAGSGAKPRPPSAILLAVMGGGIYDSARHIARANRCPPAQRDLVRDTAANLALALAGGFYQPTLPELVSAPGGDGRLMARYALPETILSTALHRALAPRIDARLHPACIGGRKGRSRFSFPPLLDAARARGLHWVLVTDVADFFASIAPVRLDAVLAAPPFRLARDVREFCLRLACGDGSRGLLIGTALGMPLANAFLHACDERLAAAAPLFCRYMDDIAVFAGTRSAAELELRRLEAWLLSERGLRISVPKTGVYHRTREGFEFLGLRVIGASALPAPRNVERFEGQVRDWLARCGRRSAAKTLLVIVSLMTGSFGPWPC